MSTFFNENKQAILDCYKEFTKIEPMDDWGCVDDYHVVLTTYVAAYLLSDMDAPAFPIQLNTEDTELHQKLLAQLYPQYLIWQMERKGILEQTGDGEWMIKGERLDR